MDTHDLIRPIERLYSLLVQLRVVAKNAFLIERYPPLGAEIREESRSGGDAIVECDHASILGFKSRHRAWKRVAQAGNHLKHREIDVGNFFAQKIFRSCGITLQYSLKVAEVLRHALGCEIGGASFGFGFLLFVIKAASYRMVCIGDLGNPVGDRQLQLMSPEAARFGFRNETQAWA